LALLVISCLSFVLIFCFVTSLLIFRIGWSRVKPFYRDEHRVPKTKVSILIAARNEEKKLYYTILDILAQNYPAELLELIVVDDHSTDGTADIVRSFANQKVILIQLNESQVLNSYKKKAISRAIDFSKGELIITTDADCRMNVNWLSTIVSFYEEKNLKMISSPVVYHEESSVFEKWQTLDFLFLNGLGASAIGNKMPSTCNGANLAYRRDLFYELGGFRGIDDLASGDDELFLHKVASKYPGHIGYCKSVDAIVYTHAMPDLASFINQRKRWSSKSTRYKNILVILLGIMIWLTNLSICVNLLLGFVSSNCWIVAAVSIASKFTVEMIFMIPVARFVKRTELLPHIVYLTIIHPFYVAYIGFAGNSGKYVWKGRLVK
jgi:cellulose synthase/poly-beta-1,6-N-acetylglucosamine synthase-like glycosyltransferase